MATAQPRAAQPPDGIDFINENDAGRMLFPLFKQVTHSRRSDAHEHFHEIRATDAEERNRRFSGNGFRQKGFSSSRRADDQDSFGDSPTEFLKFLWIF